MRFSIIMASYLGEYRTAASNREGKILRAVNSVINQSFDSWELIVIADGCEKTMQILEVVEDIRVNCYSIPKSKLWSGEPRNEGLIRAKGEFILYLDIDDIYGPDHLKNINSQLNGYDWVWFDDVRYNSKYDQWYENPCNINKISEHGTSNVCHKRSMPAKWDYTGYAHDYYFILHLKESKNFTKIQGGEYYVCHVPGGNPTGYDI
jgi:glycosyltransferase involved in cell wall biosynthesis